MRRVLLALLILIAGGMAWIRLAPDDPAWWNRATKQLSDPFWEPGRDFGPLDAGRIEQKDNSARLVATIRGSTASALLELLDQVALETPRTHRLAGTPDSGMITWVTRSAIFGFPDYTTAQAVQDGPDVSLAILARSRYGRRDFGVNQARLADWLARLGAD